MESQKGWSDRITYEIFVQSFCDSNGDGIGDLQGVISKLDYIQSIGADAIWLMPIHPSSTYHKYEVNDYYDIDPDYGSLDDFKQLLEEAHKRDILILIDLVINHTSWEHPWFVEGLKNPTGPYRSYYVWENLDSVKKEIRSRENKFDTDHLSQWNPVAGSDQLYYSFFYKTMPDLNYENQAVRDEIYKIGKYWLEMGVDGFRLDGAKYIYREHEMDKTVEFWSEFGSKMKEVREDAFLVGEVWADRNVIAPYHQGLDACFNFDISFMLADLMKGSDSIDLVGEFLAIEDLYEKENPEFVNATFLKNHDQDRILSELGGDTQKARQAAAILFSLPGAPYVYYGEELGMTGRKPDENIREPVIWEQNSPENTNWLKAEYNKEGEFSSVSEQESDPQSMLNYYRKIIKVRKENSCLGTGQLSKLDTEINGLLAYKRMNDLEEVKIFHNVGLDTVTVEITYDSLVFSTGNFKADPKGFILDPGASIFLK